MDRVTDGTNLENEGTGQGHSVGEDSWVIRVQEDSLSRISGWIQAADAKASPILAIDAALTATLVALAARPGAWSTSSPYWLAIGCVLPLVSSILISLAMFPRITGNLPSLLYFGDIASISPEEYRGRVVRRSPGEYLDDLIAQSHTNSKIATKKFRWVRLSTLVLVVGVIPWLVALFFLVGG